MKKIIHHSKFNLSFLNLLKNLFKKRPKTRAQLIELLKQTEQDNILDFDSLSMIEGILQVSEMHVRDIMLPLSQMVVVQENENLKTMLPTIIKSGHSRFAVIGEDRDEVLGILLAKDLLKFCHDAEKEFSIHDVLRPAIFVPESKRLDVLLREFRQSHNHIAIVVDEYGGIEGLITIEDILEQIVGDIEDEYDIYEKASIKKHSETEYTVKASTTIEEFNAYFSTKFDEEEFDTVGGLVTHAFSHIPKRGESANIDNLSFTVLHADSRRIHLISVKKYE